MTGQHDAGFTRIAPTPGYVGRHRCAEEPDPGWWAAWQSGQLYEPEPDDPPRCWSCGHTTDMFCECQCCNDDDPDGEWNPNA